jgi:hypothetical protein
LHSSRLNQPDEVAHAVCASISGTGHEPSACSAAAWQWSDIGWHLPV